jgi:hypothetical protein
VGGAVVGAAACTAVVSGLFLARSKANEEVRWPRTCFFSAMAWRVPR